MTPGKPNLTGTVLVDTSDFYFRLDPVWRRLPQEGLPASVVAAFEATNGPGRFEIRRLDVGHTFLLDEARAALGAADHQVLMLAPDTLAMAEGFMVTLEGKGNQTRYVYQLGRRSFELRIADGETDSPAAMARANGIWVLRSTWVWREAAYGFTADGDPCQLWLRERERAHHDSRAITQLHRSFNDNRHHLAIPAELQRYVDQEDAKHHQAIEAFFAKKLQGVRCHTGPYFLHPEPGPSPF